MKRFVLLEEVLMGKYHWKTTITPPTGASTLAVDQQLIFNMKVGLSEMRAQHKPICSLFKNPSQHHKRMTINT